MARNGVRITCTFLLSFVSLSSCQTCNGNADGCPSGSNLDSDPKVDVDPSEMPEHVSLLQKKGATQDKDELSQRRNALVAELNAVENALEAVKSNETEAGSTSGDCLCTFDIDRTLTGKQYLTSACPNNEVTECSDNAYGYGKLTLSEAGKSLANTFCANCYVGIVTAGSASGANSCERDMLLKHLKARGKVLSEEWSGPSKLHEGRRNCGTNPRFYQSTLVAGCNDGTKQNAVIGVLAWMKTKGVHIDPQNVWHYDDRADNTMGFKGTGMNARQISCSSRDRNKVIGLCGAKESEIVNTPGIHTC